MKIRLALLLVSTLYSWFSFAQDPRFSQFYASPLQLNPAMNGVFEGSVRLTANYRELYSSILADDAFRTLAAGVELRNRVGKSNDYYSLSFSALRDEVGISKFNRYHGHLGVSYLKQLDGSRYRNSDQFLVAGAQLGAGQRSFEWSNLWFSSQFNNDLASIDFGSPSGEDFSQRETDLYLDFNAGVLWYAVLDKNASIYAGAAMHHLNQPNVSFVESAAEVLHTRWVAHAGGEIPFTQQLSLMPAVAVMGQHKGMSTTAGANLRYTNRDWREVAIRAGAWAHLANKLDQGTLLDAVAVTTMLEMDRMIVGISYDVTTSVLSTANNARGAFELSLVYVQPAKTRFRVNCPRF
jgi:type IX secretion system PorP/SprF family membrane protein